MSSISGLRIRAKSECDDINRISRGALAIERSVHRNRGIDAYTDSRIYNTTIDVNNSGTALRFLTAYAAARTGAVVRIVGSGRLCSRPVGHLVDALAAMGADIRYLGEQGCAPLLIRGRKLHSCHLSLPGNVSSQYFSALMLIAPLVDGDLTIDILGNTVSKSYIGLTARYMEMCGVKCRMTGNSIVIPHCNYSIPREASVVNGERDWSSATFWLAAVAICPGLQITLPGLSLTSLQPDASIVGIFGKLGAVCSQKSKIPVVCVEHCNAANKGLVFNGIDNPDAIPAVLVTACMLGIDITITGADTLKIKESDRANALVDELAKCGFAVDYNGTDTLSHTPGGTAFPEGEIVLSAHADHRMAMALALISLKHDNVTIDNHECVDKSYHDFWTHLAQVKEYVKSQKL